MPAAFDLDWKSIDAALIAGVSYQDVARAHGLLSDDGSPDTVALRKRVSRLDLPIPARVRARAAQIASESREMSKNESRLGDDVEAVTKQSQGAKNGQNQALSVTKPLELAAETLLEQGIEASHLASRLAVTALKSAKGTIMPMENLTDVKTAMGIARTAAGMDRAVTQIAVAVTPAWGAAAQAESQATDWSE